MSTVTLPQARIPLGWAQIGAQRIPVEIDIEWMRALAALVTRTGGVTSSGTFDQYLPLLAAPQVISDPVAQEAIRAVDELRNELASARSDVQMLRGLVEEQQAEIAALRPQYDLRNRIELIEDRLQ